MIPINKAPPDQYDQKIQWIKDNQHLCIMPYNTHHMQVEFDGQRDVTKQQTFFKNSCCCNLSWDPGLDSTNNGLGQVAVDVKTEISRGHRSERCKVCYDQENQTGVSERTMALASSNTETLQRLITDQTFDEFNVRIKFSNLCNLACRSCSPTYSSKYAQVHGIEVPKEVFQDIGDDPTYWKYINDSFLLYFKKFKFVNLTLLGGESLIQPGAIKLLSWLESKGLLERVNLSITSNFTNINTKVMTWLTKFNTVHFSASIDSVHENFEYVRWPASFQTVINNLLAVDSVHTNSKQITIQPLINLNNLFYIVDILDFWQTVSKSLRQNIKIEPVSMFRPHHMTVQNLPLEYRIQAKDILDQAIDHGIWQDQTHGLLEYLKGIRNFVCSNEEVYNQFELYLFDTARHDRLNNTTMQQGNAKFYELLTDSHKKLYDQYFYGAGINLLPPDQQQIFYNLPL